MKLEQIDCKETHAWHKSGQESWLIMKYTDCNGDIYIRSIYVCMGSYDLTGFANFAGQVHWVMRGTLSLVSRPVVLQGAMVSLV